MNDHEQPWDGHEAPEEFIERAPCGLVSTAPDGTLLAVNDTFSQWTGYARSELVGSRRLVQLFTKASQIYYHTHYESLLRLQSFAHEIAFDVVRSDGRILPVFVNAIEKHGPDGSVALVRVAVFAATQRRRYERELLLERRSAEDAVSAKADFLAMFAHEVRNPLTAVLMHVDLLDRPGAEPVDESTVPMLRASLNKVIDLLNDMLKISKLDAGRVSLHKTEFELANVVQAVVHTMAPLAENKGLRVEVQVDPELPKRLLGDPVKLDQILTNLVGNATKFTERGQITIGVKRVEQSNDTVTVRFWVEDTGIGIDIDRQPNIFDAYVQADASVERRFGGTGLGLSIARKLVELHGGRLGVKSQLGCGSTFEFQLTFEIVR
ncbi:MAG: ATP-binding protein [Polyangiaceae bacterium]